MARSRRPIAVALLVLAGLLGPGAAAAPAQQPTCGQVVTEDVRLEGNVDCMGQGLVGLVVGAHGITIDLNGFGVREGIGIRGPGIGIDNSGG